MASTWTIKANDRCFGPYTLEQMRSFAAEGRLALHSLVAPAGENRFLTASEYGELAALFRPAEPSMQRTLNLPQFDGGRGAYSKSKVAVEIIEPKASLDPKYDTDPDPANEPHFRPDDSVQRPVFFTAEGDLGNTYAVREPEKSPPSRFVILADMKSRSIAGLEQEISRCGQVITLMPQAWLLSSEMTINTLRNALIQKLGRIDMLFIIDATHNKAAWFNFGIEIESRIRRIWQESQRP